MPRSRTDMMQMYRIAKMYYMDAMTQEQIAAVENISRSQVSRLLEQARQRGIVEINVRMPERISLNELRNDLVRELRLKDVAIAPLQENASEEDAIEAIATAAAGFLPKELKNCPVPIVLAGGPKGADILDTAADAVRCGVKGFCFGRNLFQSEDAAERIEKLYHILHK